MPAAHELGLHTLLHLATVTSTMDEAHGRASTGVPAGLLVVADRQTAGRGRSGNRWTSEGARGLWMTLLERPGDASMLRVLSLRVGLAIARALETLTTERVLVKWPNDLYMSSGKLGGILIEARWRESIVDWVAIGVGINLRVPASLAGAAALPAGVTRAALLRCVVPAVRAAAHGAAWLGVDELQEWHARDLAIGRRIIAPVAGTVQGVASDGALLVCEDGQALPTALHAGSMVFANEPSDPNPPPPTRVAGTEEQPADAGGAEAPC